MKKLIATTSIVFAAASVAGCSTIARSTGAGRTVPDEFKVVTKAPLTVPPEYALRPPEVGQATPPEVSTDRRNITFAFGTDVGVNASAIEKRMVREANAIATDPQIRALVDYETGKTLRKPSEMSNAILSSDDTSTAEAGDSATGGGDVIIQRETSGRIKLPGT